MNKLQLSKYYLDLNENNFDVLKIKELGELLAYHSDLYYNKETPIISDYEYDLLFEKLKNLEEKFGIEKKETSKVGSEVSSSTFVKVKHSRPMISLANTYNENDLIDFDKRIKRILKKENLKITYTLEYKFDGLGIELIYKDGNLIQAITRGDGIFGEDVTKNVMTIKNIPKEISYKNDLEVRGEIIMPISSFEELNKNALKTGEKIFSNPRNAASGSLRTIDFSVTKKRNLKFFAYDLSNFGDFLEKKDSYFENIKTLESLGFEISDFFIKCENILEIIKKIKNFKNKKLDFDIDGLVVKVNDFLKWKEIGFTSHHPRYAVAYKFPAQILTTKVLGVDFQVGRTGTITPVANLEKINIGGVIVKRATLHNFDEIKNLQVKILDSVFIKRAGEVIPKIVGVIKEERNGNEKEIIFPTKCPSCGTNLLKDKDKVRLYCPNTLNCKEQIKQKIINSVGKGALNIDGLGKNQIKLFLEKGFIKDLGDIYDLENKKDLILKIEGYKEKSVNNLFSSIEKSKIQNITNFLVALNISGIGTVGAKNLAKILKGNNDLLNFNYSLENLEELNDIGTETAKNIYNFFTLNENKILIEKLLKNIKINYLTKKIKTGKYLNKKICITGSFENFKRDDLIKKLEEKGGTFVSTVSKNTNFLLAGEKAGSKLKKAKNLGIEIIDLEEFLK